MNTFLRINRSRPALGFSMVELLVAMAILAIGLLGLATLQVATTKSGTTARERGTATMLAHNILDRIQAEGAVTAAERVTSDTGVVTSTGFKFVDPGLTDKVSADADNLEFDIQGRMIKPVNEVPAAEQSTFKTVFLVSWRRQNGVLAGTSTATQEFIVNIRWQEPKADGTLENKFLSVIRNVRV